MSDQLQRLLDKLELDIPEEHSTYFQSRDIALLQWVWQNRQLQLASTDEHFIGQCIQEEAERIASVRVDIMVEAQQLGFELPNAKPSVYSLCAAVVWWGQQHEWHKWMESAKPVLERLKYPEPLPAPSYNDADIQSLQRWLETQEGYEELVLQLKEKAKWLEWLMPEFFLPYEPEQIADIERILNIREQLWVEFAAAEEDAADLDWHIKVPGNERTQSRLNEFKKEIQTQKGLRNKVLVMNQQLLERDSEPIPLIMPISSSVVERARHVLERYNQCVDLIAQHQKILLPWYKNRVEEPKAPFNPDVFEEYITNIEPYIRRSRFMRNGAPFGAVLVVIVGFVLFQSYYYMQVQQLKSMGNEIGWDIQMEGPVYSPESIAFLREQLDESIALKPTVDKLSENYAFYVSPPYNKVQIKFVESVHSNVVVLPAARFQSSEVPEVTFSISQFLIVTRSEITTGLWNQVGPELASSVCGASDCLDIQDSECGDDCPVVGVSWIQAAAFANALSLKMGLPTCYSIKEAEVIWADKNSCSGWRLPTEAEWVYAAGADLNKGSQEVSLIATSSSGSNENSLDGMMDNAHEWTWDVFADWPHGEHVDYNGPSGHGARVVRGGERSSQPVDMQDKSIGFRLVRSMNSADE